MTVSIKIWINKDQVSPIIIESNRLSVAELKTKIAKALGLKEKVIKNVEITINQAQKKSVDNLSHLTLDDVGIKDNSQISVALTTKKTIVTSENNQESDAQVKYGFHEEQRLKNMRAARSGLRKALNHAQKSGAHVIITVGSYLNENSGEERLRRQQFPIELLGAINPCDPVHLIHIDPGFINTENNDVLQFHEQKGWKLITEDKNSFILTYIKDNYAITTIPHEIEDDVEGSAYFEGLGKTSKVLNVNLEPYIEVAQKEGRGFITGNFYSIIAEPVIYVAPASPDHDKENDDGSSDTYSWT